MVARAIDALIRVAVRTSSRVPQPASLATVARITSTIDVQRLGPASAAHGPHGFCIWGVSLDLEVHVYGKGSEIKCSAWSHGRDTGRDPDGLLFRRWIAWEKGFLSLRQRRISLAAGGHRPGGDSSVRLSVLAGSSSGGGYVFLHERSSLWIFYAGDSHWQYRRGDRLRVPFEKVDCVRQCDGAHSRCDRLHRAGLCSRHDGQCRL